MKRMDLIRHLDQTGVRFCAKVAVTL